MSTTKSRIRGSNYSESDKLLLLSIVEQFKNILENKLTDGVTWKEKEAAWEKVAKEFNASSVGIERMASSLKSCYENIKKNARKATADEKVELFKSESDKLLLLSIAEQFQTVFENRATDGESCMEKEAAWEKVASEFNASRSNVSLQRTATFLRALYEEIRKNARKAVSEEKVEVHKTGGGTCRIRPSQLHERAVALIPGTVNPLSARFDSDSGFNNMIANAKKADKQKPVSSLSCGSTLGLNLDRRCTQEYTMDEEIPAVQVEIVECEGDFDWGESVSLLELPESVAKPVTNQVGLTTPKPDWSDYSVKMLRMPAHPALQRRATVPEISSPDRPKISSHSHTPLSLSLPSLATPPNNSRRRPSLQKPPTSEVTNKFDKLAEAKLELVSLQIDILRSDNKRKSDHEVANNLRRKEAEEEEHRVKIQLLEVELQIKQEILKQEQEKTKQMKSRPNNDTV